MTAPTRAERAEIKTATELQPSLKKADQLQAQSFDVFCVEGISRRGDARFG